MPKLQQDPLFIEKITPFDYTKYSGLYALEIQYTNGDKQMLTTKSTNPNVFQEHDFETYEEMIEFYNKYKK